MLMALMGLLMALGVMVVDVGMAYGSRREAQTAADLAALAGAGLLPDDPTGAQTLVLDYLKSNGLDPADPDVTAQVPFPSANQIEVLVSAPSRTFFSGVFAINGLDRVSGRAVAEGQPDVPGGGGLGGGAAPPIPIPVLPAASPVDGRLTIGDGYTKLGDLYGGSTDYGDILVARDGFFISFAMVLNGPDTGGPVGNENVYYPRAKDNGGVDLHADYQTGWKKHDFKALEKSDRAHFQVGCDGAAIHDFEQDYLRPDGAGWTSDANGDGQIVTAGPTESASSLEWNPENPTLTGWGDDPGEDPLTQSPRSTARSTRTTTPRTTGGSGR